MVGDNLERRRYDKRNIRRYKTELKNDKACRLDGFISSEFTNKNSGTGKGFMLGGLVGRFESIHE